MTARPDAPDTAASRRRETPPRQRRGATRPRGYDQATKAFHARAQKWLLLQPARTVTRPDDLPEMARLGVPCRRCGDLVYHRFGSTNGHTITWSDPAPDGHWASGITATCEV